MIANLILCPKCGEEIEVTQALKHQVEEQVLSAERTKHKAELEEVVKKVELKALEKAQEDFGLKLKNAAIEAEEEKVRRKKLEVELLEAEKMKRQLKQESEEQKIEMMKKLASEEEKIRSEAVKKAEEGQSLKIREKDKQLTDLQKKVDELSQKLSQGSQQTQGEVLELEIEEILRQQFPNDEIRPVPKGIRGADVIQVVKDRQGRECGIILWESKNAKWTDSWLAKLREDQRLVTSDVAVLVSVNLPEQFPKFGYKEGIWITDRSSLAGLAAALRINLHDIFVTKQSAVGKNEKMEDLYRYLTGVQFKQRVEAIVEAFTNLQDELEKEKRFFMVKWARQEKEIRKVMDHTHGMHGDLQGIVGAALPEIKMEELPEAIVT